MAMGENDCVSMRAPGFSSAGDAQRHDPPPLRLQRRITGYRRLRRAQIAPERHAASRQPHCEQDRSPGQAPRRLIRISARSRQGKTELPTPLGVALGPAGFCRRESRDASQRSLHAG